MIRPMRRTVSCSGHSSVVWAVALLCVGPAAAEAQARASVSGFVKDSTSGETLLQARVTLLGTLTATTTNTAGYYTLPDLAPGRYTLVVTYIGYRPHRQEMSLAPGEVRRLDVEMVPQRVVLEAIEVVGAVALEEEVRRIGAAQLSTDVIRQMPALLEPDVFRSLQLLPGVKSSSDYSSGLYIRGGSPDQTLILLDRTTVYNPTHFFGFFSTFNPDAIKDVRLYKGAYPATYGGRLGSVLDIYNKDGNRRRTQGSASMGLLASRAIVEGPYSRGSYMLALRRSTLEPLLASLRKARVEGIPDRFYFYDVNGKLNVDASPNDHLSLAVYGGTDALALSLLGDARVDLAYGNRTVSATWTHVFSRNLFANVTATASRYFSEPNFDVARTTFTRVNAVRDVSVKGDFEYTPSAQHQIEAGFWAGRFAMRLRDTFDGEETLSEEIRTAYAALHVQDTYRPSVTWSLLGGVRANYFAEGGYWRVEPRVSLEHRPAGTVRLQLGYGRYYQFLTLVSSELFSGFDIWLTTGDGVPPASGDQVVAGVKTTLAPDVNLDVEAYARTMRNLFELDPFLPDAAGLDYADLFHYGSGYAYGAELLLERRRGRATGFLGYTFGVTRRRFPNLNEFRYYPPKYDRTHELNLVLNYDLTPAWRLAAVFNYATGQAYTEPAQQFKLLDNPFGSSDRSAVVSAFNAARLPPYHRLDLGVSRRASFFGWGAYELQLQLINAYGRRNTWFYLFEFENDGGVKRSTVPQIPVPIPNVAFTVRF